MNTNILALLCTISFLCLLIGVILVTTKILMIDTDQTEIVIESFALIAMMFAMYCLIVKMDGIEQHDPEQRETTE